MAFVIAPAKNENTRKHDAPGRTICGRTDGPDDSEGLFCSSSLFARPKVSWRAVPNFTVEVCFVVTKNYTAAFNSSEDLVEYIGAMTNWAQLPFTDMQNPRVSLQVNKVVVVEDDILFNNKSCGRSTDALKYHPNDTVCGFDAVVTINNTVDYINLCVQDSCDIIFLLTREELTLDINGTFTTQVSGMTTIGGICSWWKVAVGEDSPHTYSGRVTLAHEIGHLLGCDHDGCPTSRNCSSLHGNLMTQADKGMQNKSKLSECCKDRIRYLVSTIPDSCLHVNTTASVPNDLLPGENMTHEKFCALMHPGLKAVPVPEKNALECEVACGWNKTDEETDVYEYSEEEESTATESTTEYYEQPDYDVYQSHALLDGMPCTENKTCYRGICDNHNWTAIKLNYRTFRAFTQV